MGALISLLMMLAIGYVAIGLIMILGVLSYYAATWVLIVVSMLLLIPIRLLWRDKHYDSDNTSLIFFIVLAGGLMWTISLIGQYPNQWDTLCDIFKRSVMR